MSIFKETIYRLTCVVIFIVAWHLFASLYSSPVFPSPLKVFNSLTSLLTRRENFSHIFITISRVFEAILIAMPLGCTLGILPRYSKQARYFIKTIIYPLFQSVSPLVWVLLFAMWFGLSSISPVIATALVALPYVLIPVSQGIEELDKTLIELGYSFTKKKIKIFKHIVIPLLYPYFFTAFRSSFGFMWRFIIVAEIFLAISGVGYMMGTAREMYNVSRLLAWTIIITAILVFFEYGILDYVKKKTIGKGKT